MVGDTIVQTPSGVTIGDGCLTPGFESMLEIDNEGEFLGRGGAGRPLLLVSTTIAVGFSAADGDATVIYESWSTDVI